MHQLCWDSPQLNWRELIQSAFSSSGYLDVRYGASKYSQTSSVCVLLYHSFFFLFFSFSSNPQSLASIGNKKARDRFEAKVPPCWLKPQPNSRQ